MPDTGARLTRWKIAIIALGGLVTASGTATTISSQTNTQLDVVDLLEMNTLLNPVLPESFFHFDIVVPNLEKKRAIAQYSDTFGIRFTEPSVGRSHFVEDPDRHLMELVTAFSRTQPPYLELVQATGDGIVSSSSPTHRQCLAPRDSDQCSSRERFSGSASSSGSTIE
jgi:hypothetical protein